MVSLLAFYFYDPSSNPAEALNFFCEIVVEKVKYQQKGPVLVHENIHLDIRRSSSSYGMIIEKGSDSAN